MSGAGRKRPNVECQDTASIYHKRENRSIIRRQISDSRQDLGLTGPFETLWGPKKNDQADAHQGPQNFHMPFRSLQSAQYSQGYILDNLVQLGFYVGPKGPGGSIFYTILKYFLWP